MRWRCGSAGRRGIGWVGRDLAVPAVWGGVEWGGALALGALSGEGVMRKTNREDGVAFTEVEATPENLAAAREAADEGWISLCGPPLPHEIADLAQGHTPPGWEEP